MNLFLNNIVANLDNQEFDVSISIRDFSIDSALEGLRLSFKILIEIEPVVAEKSQFE